MRCRSALVVIASSSFLADFLILRLYLATPFQILNDVFEPVIGFMFAGLERFEILCILGKCLLNRIVDQV